MKFVRNVAFGTVGLVLVLGIVLLGSAMFTRNQTGDVPAALDNINPLVREETVYASTDVAPVRHFLGGGGEDEYVYVVKAVNARGKVRKIQFNAQWRLKPGKYLAVKTKGQNVESWQAVTQNTLPAGAQSLTE
ncbi:YxeA family protein [Lacticaseibacillus hulanensis]|jgi:uncharacterized protein (TIGR01655 family)|uniref:YxeA family protein n=1 Tax=Lacticaseibacillus hulanensis TaxID=2493111 RepID=UPI000FDBE9D6|nr:YxeA family protein [Lacticaseibacillus hulanensis]